MILISVAYFLLMGERWTKHFGVMFGKIDIRMEDDYGNSRIERCDRRIYAQTCTA
ncbi:hypothetical protein SLU01_10830 [Sporosarcina luteola]|uniref:Uncharacterized protein n=1 Tax=Sporosarcina luteola TaxID=582850 RepID=A0A511Z5P6_9BACL|nr:hypothetical protein SLU01_10830 [Sporosarcina luteola]